MIFLQLWNEASSRHRKAVRQNPIPGLKKSGFDLYTRRRDLFRDTRLDRSPQEKNFPNTDACWWRNTTEINVEISASVTTNHMFLQHPPWTAGALLPISRPNSNSLGGKGKERAKGGWGGHAHAVVESAISISSSGKFTQMGPCPTLLLKKSSVAPSRSQHEH